MLLLACQVASGQLKPRPDAFPSVPESSGTKAVAMAETMGEMASWDRYPTYETYLEMMRHWADSFPERCTIDTIGTSVQGRLILAAHIAVASDADLYRPQFFYSSTIHGDEVTGYVMMLRLIDTLLKGYGSDERLTALMDRTDIYINPLANPDGTYRHGNDNVRGSQRENADGIDLNRNYPDPFGPAVKAIPQENQAMIDYVSSHNFRLSANLHGGSEVLNYPWDSFHSWEMPHPQAEWWQEECARLMDTLHVYSRSHFRDVTYSGYVAGGDWYVIRGGRQDYMNYYHNCLELTMEISSAKILDSDQLPSYWSFLSPMLISYMEAIHHLPDGSDGITDASGEEPEIWPNPATDRVCIGGMTAEEQVRLFDMTGRLLRTATAAGERTVVSLAGLPCGVYLLRTEGRNAKIIKQ